MSMLLTSTEASKVFAQLEQPVRPRKAQIKAADDLNGSMHFGVDEL